MAEKKSGCSCGDCLHDAVEGECAPGNESGQAEEECNGGVKGGEGYGADGVSTGSDNSSDGDAVKAVADVFVGNGHVEDDPHEDKSEEELGEENFSGLQFHGFEVGECLRIEEWQGVGGSCGTEKDYRQVGQYGFCGQIACAEVGKGGGRVEVCLGNMAAGVDQSRQTNGDCERGEVTGTRWQGTESDDESKKVRADAFGDEDVFHYAAICWRQWLGGGWFVRFAIAGGIGFKDEFDLVADSAEGIEFGFAGANGVGGIFEAPVVALTLSGKAWAGLIGVAADGDDGVDAGVEVLVEMVRGVFAGVVADFAKGFDGEGVDFALGLRSGAENFKEVACSGAEDAFSHVAAAGVSGAEDEYFGFGHSWHRSG